MLGLAAALLPAAIVSTAGAVSAVLGTLSGPRKAAIRETVEGRSRAALDRYLEHSPVVEARWLVVRVIGIATSAGLLVNELGSALDGWAPLAAAVFALIAYGVPAEVLRGVCLRAPEKAALLLLQVVYPFEVLAAPIAAPLAMLGGLVGRKVVTRPQTIPPPHVTETEVEILVNEGEAAGALDHEQSEMIKNVLEFRGLTAGEAMVPRTRVTALDVSTPPRQLLAHIAESGHSRYPVYRDRIDNVIGILHAKDLLTFAAEHQKLDSLDLEGMLRRPVAFVPETQNASNVLRDMRAGRHHLAIVIDEFGGMSGIVTLEDLVEEIVGDIQDEHDVEEQRIVELEDGRYTVDASVEIYELARVIGATLPEDADYNTVAGLIMGKLGRVPKVEDKVTQDGWEFVVKEADDRRVIKVEVAREGSTTVETSKPPRVRGVTAA